MTFQRTVQACSLTCFIILLWLTTASTRTHAPVDLFLRLDPMALAGTALSARAFIGPLWVALLIVAATVVAGRFFCGAVCPMGITIDVADRLIAGKGRRGPAETTPKSWRRVKYQVLLFVLGAALLGVSLVFVASPLSWITRFYGLLVHPALSLIGKQALIVVRPLANRLDWVGLAYAQVSAPRFDFQWVTVLFFLAVFAGACHAPRFWCRYVCPSGALLALAARRPVLRRRVTDACIQCGLCRQSCPMDAIGQDATVTDHGECIVCETCVRVCPVKAVSFGVAGGIEDRPEEAFSADRRTLIGAGLYGMGAALVTLTGVRQLHGKPGPGDITHPGLIRPPGALPEKEFLARCLRCGECMKVCPTNALQPIGLEAGWSGLLSPAVVPRRGACDFLCNACGQVCPTNAIRPLPLSERVWAKVGTAHVLRHKCLAWEFDKKCLICGEFCPYDALQMRMVPGIAVPVPFVVEARCSGCGLCEFNCPVQATPAIVVEPMGALRLGRGSYRAKGRAEGLFLCPRSRSADEAYGYPEAESGFTANPGGLPPGFTE